MSERFKALVVNKTETDFSVNMESICLDDLPKGDVTIRVHYSSVNFKDGLAGIPDGKIIRSYPMVPGIDLAGTVHSSNNPRFLKGDRVIVTSYELGVAHHGGYSEFARVPSEWVVPMPDNLTFKEAMIFGTAGFTAALSIQRLEENGLTPANGPVLVTGASGGVGSMAIAMLAKRGYHVIASTGKDSESDYLKHIGAKEIISRADVLPEKISPLGKQRWAGAVDPVGGKTLASILSHTQYGGAVAVSGLTGGVDVPTSVFPFILRGVSLLGIDSVYCSMELRKTLWNRMAADLKPGLLEEMYNEIEFKELPEALSGIIQGKLRGRTIVNIIGKD